MSAIPDAPAPVGPGFDLALRTRVVFGAGTLARLGALVRELGAHRVLLVTDAGLVASGHARAAEESLRGDGVELETYAEAQEDPDVAAVERCAAAVRAARPELLVALGGGSAIDTAKGAALVVGSGASLADLRGFDRWPAPLLPLVAVPTTAGTGSEMQSYALITDASSGAKMACGATEAAPRIALLDPALTLSLPRGVTATSGLDALGHALETAVSTKRTALSELFSREAFRLLAGSFARVLAVPSDRDARGAMLLGAGWAGLAIEHSMLGAAHSFANAFTARYGLTHGLAVALALPHVVRFNAVDPAVRARYAELAATAGLCARGEGAERALAALLAFLDASLAAAGIDPVLAAHGVEAAAVPELAEEASRQWTAQFNPRPVGRAELERILAAALHGP